MYRMRTLAERHSRNGLNLFKTRAEAVSAQVQRVATRQLAIELIVRLLHQEGVDDKPQLARRMGLSSMLGEADETDAGERSTGPHVRGYARTGGRCQGRHQPDGLGAGQHRHAGADVRTKWTSAWFPPCRRCTLRWSPPRRCCRIFPRCSIRVDPRKSAYLSFITGPSRTADIERVLTIGVHGPERLIIVLVDDLEVAA